MTRLAPLPALLLAVSLAAPAEETKGLKVPFVEGRPFAEMLKRARAEKKPLMVDVYATWCGPCKQLDRMTFSDQGFAEWAKAKVVPVKIDAEKGEGRVVARRYAVTGFPTILFIAPDGGELDRVSGVLDPPRFKEFGDRVIEGRTGLLTALSGLKKSFDLETAVTLASLLGQRNDVARLRPIVRRLFEEDPELSDPRARESFFYLVALEDADEALGTETLDLLTSLLPRMKGDPREAPLQAVAARAYARGGDPASARAAAKAGLAAAGETSPLAPELYSALALADRKAGKLDAAVSSARKALALCESLKLSPGLRAYRGIELAETLSAAGKGDEAAKAARDALDAWGTDAALLARASAVLLRSKDVAGAVASGRRAVELTQGGEPKAQAALGSALAASGDPQGAVAALARASELDPASADYRQRLADARKKAPAPKAKAS